MKKTRKGLSLVAGLSLAATSLVAAPASAAGEITLAVSAGSGTSTILGEYFGLRATVGALIPSDSYSDVKFAISNPSNATLTYGADNANTSDENTTGVTVDAASGSTSSGTTDVVEDAGSTPTKNTLLGIKTSATTATSVTVTAWIDSDDDYVIDSGEYTSNSITISFVKVADAGLSAAYVTNPQVGDTTMRASITSSVINVAQVDVTHFGVQFGVYSGSTVSSNVSSITWATTVAALSARGSAVTLNSVTKASLDTAATTLSAAVAASKSYAMRGIWSLIPGTNAWSALGTADARATVAVEADSAESSYEIVGSANVTTGGIVRKSYTGDVVYSVEVLDSDAEAVSGVTVRLTTTSSTSATGTIKINGVTVSETATQTHDAVTNASGIATFTVTNNEGSASDVLAVTTITAQGVSIASDATDLNWDPAAYQVRDIVATATGDVTRAVDSGASHTFTFHALDQWSTPLSASDVRISAAATGRTVGTVTDTFADGAATITIVDGALTTGDTTVTLTVQELTAGVWGSLDDYSGAITGVGAYTLKYFATTAVNEVTVTANNGTTSDLAAAQTRVTAKEYNTELNHLVAAISTFDAGATPGTTLDDETVTISGTVRNSTTLVSKAGAWITISGSSDILFVQGNVAKFGSLSFYDADGAYSVNAYSNKSMSSSVVTITSSGASKTAKVTFAAGETNVGTAITFTGPSTANAGDAIQVVAKLTDKFGNAVDTDIAGGSTTNWDGDANTDEVGEKDAEISVTVTGPGVSLSTLPTATGSDGTLSVSRLLGSNDKTGTITVTVVYGGADGVIGTGLDDIAATHTITVGAVAAPAADTKVNAGSFKGYVAVYAKGYAGKRLSAKVGNDWVVVPALASNFVRVVEYTGAGYTIAVRIYIDRVLVDTITVTTK